MPKKKKRASYTTRLFKYTIFILWAVSKLGEFQIHVSKSAYSRLRFRLPKWRLPSLEKTRYILELLLRFFSKFLPKPLQIGLLLTLTSFIIFFYSFYLILLANDLPNPNRLKELQSPITTEIYDKAGKILYRVYENKNRSRILLSELPKHLIDATIAIEDKNFYIHPGVDIYGVARAAIANIKNGQFQGGSTITQQLIKNTLLSSDRTWKRKVQEIILAFWASKIYTKDEILQMYFNKVAYGGATQGVEAASLTYFNKSAKSLSLAQSSFLAGLSAAPTRYSPYGSHPELAKKRQLEVLRRMVEDGYITKEEAQKAQEEELDIKPPLQELDAPHFVMYVRSILEEKYGTRTVTQGGLKVYTTLDLGLQQTVEKIIKEEVSNLEELRVSNGAAVVVDGETGYILAMQGSMDYYNPKFGNFNAALALRQPGSSIKPVTYITAFNTPKVT